MSGIGTGVRARIVCVRTSSVQDCMIGIRCGSVGRLDGVYTLYM